MNFWQRKHFYWGEYYLRSLYTYKVLKNQKKDICKLFYQFPQHIHNFVFYIIIW